jgi:hypothetical protein
MFLRVKCNECGKTLPVGSDLCVQMVLATSDGVALVGTLNGGRVSPAHLCPECAKTVTSRAIDCLVAEYALRSQQLDNATVACKDGDMATGTDDTVS